jgi:hypothetical protein
MKDPTPKPVSDPTNNQPAEEKMSDPVTNAGLAIAQFAVKEGFKYIATKAADANCS